MQSDFVFNDEAYLRFVSAEKSLDGRLSCGSR